MEPLPGVVAAFLKMAVSDVVCGADSSYAVVESTGTGANADKHHMVYSWGWGWEGRLGREERGDMPLPRPVTSLAGMNVLKIACGDAHVLVIVDDGALYSFGRNSSGQAGVGSTCNHVLPTKV